MGSGKVSYGTLKMINGLREPVVELKNGHCNVKTLQLSISKMHKVKLIIDLLCIGVMPIGIFCANENHSFFPALVVSIFCSITWMIITIIDFRDWFYTKNKQLEQMGEWYLEDCTNIFNDLLNAGSKVCSQMVEEERRRNIEASKSQNKQDICS